MASASGQSLAHPRDRPVAGVARASEPGMPSSLFHQPRFRKEGSGNVQRRSPSPPEGSARPPDRAPFGGERPGRQGRQAGGAAGLRRVLLRPVRQLHLLRGVSCLPRVRAMPLLLPVPVVPGMRPLHRHPLCRLRTHRPGASLRSLHPLHPLYPLHPLHAVRRAVRSMRCSVRSMRASMLRAVRSVRTMRPVRLIPG